MPDIPVLKPSEVIKILQRNGFEIDRIKGSHYVLLNKTNNVRVVVPFHKSDLPKGTLHEIFKQSGLTEENFR